MYCIFKSIVASWKSWTSGYFQESIEMPPISFWRILDNLPLILRSPYWKVAISFTPSLFIKSRDGLEAIMLCLVKNQCFPFWTRKAQARLEKIASLGYSNKKSGTLLLTFRYSMRYSLITVLIKVKPFDGCWSQIFQFRVNIRLGFLNQFEPHMGLEPKKTFKTRFTSTRYSSKFTVYQQIVYCLLCTCATSKTIKVIWDNISRLLNHLPKTRRTTTRNYCPKQSLQRPLQGTGSKKYFHGGTRKIFQTKQKWILVYCENCHFSRPGIFETTLLKLPQGYLGILSNNMAWKNNEIQRPKRQSKEFNCKLNYVIKLGNKTSLTEFWGQTKHIDCWNGVNIDTFVVKHSLIISTKDTGEDKMPRLT